MDAVCIKLLTDWYRKNMRILPWRNTGNPEDVWISEIMLQQTRVEAVKAYFTRFRKALPDMDAIASCPDDRLMKLWEGLGYYTRARSLKKCAESCLQNYGGQLPADYTALLSLPGMGPYTAGAVSSLAFGIPVPAVDGNVLRVLSRIDGSFADISLPGTRKAITEELQALISDAVQNSAGFSVSDFNQSLMELGALVCVPNGLPHCTDCPVRAYCAAVKNGLTDRLPVRAAKKARRLCRRTILVIRDGEKFLFRKRPAQGLLAGLYEFPGFDSELSEAEVLSEVKKLGLEPVLIRPLPEAKHIFTHIEWRMKGWDIRVASFSDSAYRLGKGDRFVTKEELRSFAVPSAFRAYIDFFALRS